MTVVSLAGLLNQLAKFLARFEEGNSLRWHFDSGSGFWIASDARSSLARVEGPESTNFHFVPRSKGTDDAVEYSANDDVGFLPGHRSGLINLFGQICPGHRVYSLRQEKEYHRVTGASDSRLELPSAAALPPRHALPVVRVLPRRLTPWAKSLALAGTADIEITGSSIRNGASFPGWIRTRGWY